MSWLHGGVKPVTRDWDAIEALTIPGLCLELGRRGGVQAESQMNYNNYGLHREISAILHNTVYSG